MGYSFEVGPECEFFLFHTDEEGHPTTVTHEKAGYLDMGPLDLGENARRDIVLALEKMDFTIETSHHEMSPGQHEIDFKYANALKTADNIVTFKLVVRSIAKRHGLFASFMPKPVFGVQGSGMHINMSLSRDGKNIFADSSDKNGLSQEAYYFIAGLMEHAKGMSLITNPLVNSYKRLVPGFEAPVYIAWSRTNRSPLIRIPATRGAGTRIELRNPDAAMNPYLALAVCLGAGLDGIEKKMQVADEVKSNIFEMTQEEREKANIEMLPGNLSEAITAFEKDAHIQSILGSHTSEVFKTAKKKEWSCYTNQISQWEIDEYLYKI